MSACVFSSRRVKLYRCKIQGDGLIKWEFEYTLFAFQDELVDKYNVEITGTIYVLDDKKVYTILEIISFHYERHQIGLTIYSCLIIII